MEDKNLLGTVIYEHNNPAQQSLVLTDLSTNKTHEYPLKDGDKINVQGKDVSLSKDILSPESAKELAEAKSLQTNTSVMLNSKEIDQALQKGVASEKDYSFRIEGTKDKEQPAQFVLSDNQKEQHHSLGVWQTSEYDSNDIYVCSFNKDSYDNSFIEESSYRDDVQLEDILTTGKYEEFRRQLDEQKEQGIPVNMELSRNDFQIDPDQLLEDEQYGFEVEKHDSLLDLKSQYSNLQQLVKAENTGELTEDKLVNRLTAENQYRQSKNDIMKNYNVPQQTISKMESNVRQSNIQKQDNLSM